MRKVTRNHLLIKVKVDKVCMNEKFKSSRVYRSLPSGFNVNGFVNAGS